MMPATIRHWLPRMADQIITARAAEAIARKVGRPAEAAEHALDAERFASIAWRAIKRSRPARIAQPTQRELRPNDIELRGRRDQDHPAYPPNWRLQ